MKIFPAIDIRNGKCVRLIKGNYDEEIIFNDDPIIVAKNFEEIGTKYVHIIITKAKARPSASFPVFSIWVPATYTIPKILI